MGRGEPTHCALATGAPQTRAPLLGVLSQPLELAAVGVREGSRASEAKLEEVLIVEVFVLSVAVCVEVDICKSTSIGVFGVADARNPEPHDAFRQDLPSVLRCPLPEAADGLAWGDGLGGIHADQPDRSAPSPYLYRDGVAVRHLRHPAIELVVSAEAVDQTVEADTRDRVEEQSKDHGESYEDTLRGPAGDDPVLVAARKDGYQARGPEELG